MKTFVKECKWGTFLLLRGDTISQFADIYGEWCELEVALFHDILSEDSNVIEVGANIGMHAIPISRFANSGKVFCFEPQRILFQMLCANSVLNDRTNIFAFQVAIGSEEKCVEIAASDYKHPWNYGAFSIEKGFSAEKGYQAPQWTEEVRVITLDSHPEIRRLESLALLKIDTEGMEIAVLDGAQTVIQRHAPAIFVENNNVDRGDLLIRRLNDLGYACYWYGVERAIAKNYNAVPMKIPGGDLNMICYKRDRVPENTSLSEATSMSDITRKNISWIQRDVPDAVW